MLACMARLNFTYALCSAVIAINFKRPTPLPLVGSRLRRDRNKINGAVSLLYGCRRTVRDVASSPMEAATRKKQPVTARRSSGQDWISRTAAGQRSQGTASERYYTEYAGTLFVDLQYI